MTTRVTVKNENQGAPYADWDIEVVLPDGTVEATLEPGQGSVFTLWHDGRAISIREKPKTPV